MDKFNLIGALKSYAEENKMVFLYGDSFFQNYEASQHEYFNGQKILGAEFSCSISWGIGNSINEITYNGSLMLGQKIDDDGTDNIADNPETLLVNEYQTFNDGTHANLDETKYQKYVRRLKELTTGLAEVIADISCVNQLNIGNCIFRMDINKFDTNIDFVVAEVTFIQ